MLKFVKSDEYRIYFVSEKEVDDRLVLLAVGIAVLEERGNIAPATSKELVSGQGKDVEAEAERMGRDSRVRMAVMPFEQKIEAAKKYIYRKDYPASPNLRLSAYSTYDLSMDYAHVPWPVYAKLGCWKKIGSKEPFYMSGFEWQYEGYLRVLERANSILESGLLKNIDPETITRTLY